MLHILSFWEVFKKTLPLPLFSLPCACVMLLSCGNIQNGRFSAKLFQWTTKRIPNLQFNEAENYISGIHGIKSRCDIEIEIYLCQECRGHGTVSAECNCHCFVPSLSLWTRRHGQQTAEGLQQWHLLFHPEVTRSMRVHSGVCYWKCGNMNIFHLILFDLILSKWRGR